MFIERYPRISLQLIGGENQLRYAKNNRESLDPVINRQDGKKGEQFVFPAWADRRGKSRSRNRVRHTARESPCLYLRVRKDSGLRFRPFAFLARANQFGQCVRGFQRRNNSLDSR